MKNSAYMILITVLVIIILCSGFSPAFARDVSITKEKPADINFGQVRKADPDKLMDYSGKNVIWHGTMEELLSNDAYFEYVFKLDGGDQIKVLTGRGLPFEEGDYLELEGFIMIKQGRFSHLVVTGAKKGVKKTPYQPLPEIPGLIPLGAPEEVVFNRIYSWILYYNPGISQSNARFIANRIVHYSRRHQTDPFLVTALISAESAFNIYAVSVAGALGLGQLMPGTAAALGVNPRDPDQNISGSVRYLKAQLDRWGKSKSPMALALASYNAGPGAVEKYGGIPPYQETIDYVNIVSRLYSRIRTIPGK